MDLIELSKPALLTFENSIVCIFDLTNEEVKWINQFNEEVLSAYWYRYPSKIIIHTAVYVKIYDLFWKLN